MKIFAYVQQKTVCIIYYIAITPEHGKNIRNLNPAAAGKAPGRALQTPSTAPATLMSATTTIDRLRNSPRAMSVTRKTAAALLWGGFAVTLAGGIDLRILGLGLSLHSPDRTAMAVCLAVAAGVSVWGGDFLRRETTLVTGPAAPGPKLTPAFLFAAACFFFFPAFFLYSSNANRVASWDTAPARYIPLSVMAEGDLDLGEFPELTGSPTSGYFLRENARGRVYSSYPPGSGLTALPVYALTTAINGWPETARRVEDTEKTAASFLAALACLLFFLAARTLSAPRSSAFATLALAFGTNVYSTCSQALWQHTAGVFWCCAGLFFIARTEPDATAAGKTKTSKRAMAALAAAGLCFASASASRTTNALALSCAGAYVLYRHGIRGAASLCIGALPPLLGLAFYNLSAFGSASGSGYYGTAASAGSFWAFPGPGTVAGLLISPARGLFVFSPVLLFCFYGTARALRPSRAVAHRPFYIFCLLTALGLAGTVACWKMWWGGWCFGPRLMCDLLPFAGMLLLPALEAMNENGGRRGGGLAAVFALSLLLSAAIQAEGVYSQAKEWDRHADIDNNPSRVWDFPDTPLLYPILRHAPHMAAPAGATKNDVAPKP